jgi:ribose transport system permease protein
MQWGESMNAALLDRMLRQRSFAVTVLLVALFVYFSATQDAFFTSANIDTLLTSASILWVVAIGMTFVVVSGGLDLSVGSMLALSGIAVGWFLNDLGAPALVACCGAIALGIVLGGGVNGLLIGRMGFPFIVVTLGTLILFRGLVNLWSDARSEQVTSRLLDEIAFGRVAGLPVPVWIMIVTLVVALYVQRNTYFGRDVYALGSNPEAARLSGISVTRTLASVYAIAGALAALGGVIQVGRIGAASPLVGEAVLFDAAAAVLLGGTSLRGGVGGVGGTAVGVLLLATLQNGLAVAGVATAWQLITTGTILVAALALDLLSRKGRESLRIGGRPSAAAPVA